MALLLKSVEPSRGVHWFKDALNVVRQRPFAMTGLLLVFIAVDLGLLLVPVLGTVLLLMSPPVLSLGFMIATRSALAGGRVHPAQFVEAFRAPGGRRRSLFVLCALYGLALVAIMLTCYVAGGETAQQLLVIAQQTSSPGFNSPEVRALLEEEQMVWATRLLNLMLAALSVPFWHAPGLIHWGGQNVPQALFSSTLAVWRSKGALLVYAAVFVLVGLPLTMLTTMVLVALDSNGVIVAAVLGGLAITLYTVFFSSSLFMFNDSFGDPAAPALVSPPA